MHPKANCPSNTKNGIDILIGQLVFKLWIETIKILFWSITQQPLGQLKFICILLLLLILVFVFVFGFFFVLFCFFVFVF